MDLAVAIHASAAHQIFAGVLRCASGIGPGQSTLIAGCIDAGRRTTGMGTVMTLLAKERCT